MTLSQTAVITKQVIAFTIFLLVAGTISFIGYKAWYAYYLSNLPVKEPAPDTKFGVLPLPDFPETSVSSSNFTYSIDTTTGNLPKLGIDPGFDKIIKVYFIPKASATLLSSEKSKTLAEKLNINTSVQVLSEVNYSYTEENRTLNISLDSGNFLYTKEATDGAKETLDDNNKLVADFQNFLSSLGFLKEEFKKGPTKVVLLKRDGKNWVPTTLYSEAEAAQISLWQDSIDEKQILTPYSNKALVSAIVKKSASNLDDYLSLNFTYWPVDLTTYATYPAKTPDEALSDLRSGKGIIIVEPPKPQVSITSIYPAFFLSENYTPYLQPIYVFEGPQFVSYVSAISPDFIGPD